MRRSGCNLHRLSIPLVTLACGFGVSVTLSLLEGTFWPNSRYDIPLSVPPTMTLGDAILLPWFNYRAFLAVAAARGAGLRFDRKLAAYLFISTVMSIALNSVSNYAWCHDQFTGATDTVYGQLTLLGWWHYGFSIVQMEIVFLVLGVWCIRIPKEQPTGTPAFSSSVACAHSILFLSTVGCRVQISFRVQGPVVTTNPLFGKNGGVASSIHHPGVFGFAADSSKAIFSLILLSPTLPWAAGSGPGS